MSIKTSTNCAFICFSSTIIANKYAKEGFHIGKMFINPDSLSKYDSIHVLQCYHCYEWGSHTTNQCEHPKKQKWCSICASKYHTHRYCPNEGKRAPKCLNCQGPHFAISKKCPKAKSAAQNIKTKIPQPSATAYPSQIQRPSFISNLRGQSSYAEKVKTPPKANMQALAKPASTTSRSHHTGQSSYAVKATPHPKANPNIPNRQAPIKPVPKPKATGPLSKASAVHFQRTHKSSSTNNKNKDVTSVITNTDNCGYGVRSLADIAGKLNRELHNVPMDGSCFYHAVAAALWHSQQMKIEVQCLREMVGQYLNNLSVTKQLELENFLPTNGDDKILNLIAETISDGWADHPAIQALSSEMNLTINIYDSKHGLIKIHPESKASRGTQLKPIYLGLDNEHYYAMVANTPTTKSVSFSDQTAKHPIMDKNKKRQDTQTSSFIANKKSTKKTSIDAKPEHTGSNTSNTSESVQANANLAGIYYAVTSALGLASWFCNNTSEHFISLYKKICINNNMPYLEFPAELIDKHIETEKFQTFDWELLHEAMTTIKEIKAKRKDKTPLNSQVLLNYALEETDKGNLFILPNSGNPNKKPVSQLGVSNDDGSYLNEENDCYIIEDTNLNKKIK